MTHRNGTAAMGGTGVRESISPGPCSASPTPDAAPGWHELASASGRSLLGRIADERGAGDSLDAIARRLRAEGADPALLAAALTQTELRDRARAKFGPAAAAMLFTRAALEQATRSRVAELHAARFREAGCEIVADLGCGIGTESLALLAAGLAVRPVELDPLTAAFAQHNLLVRATEGPPRGDDSGNTGVTAASRPGLPAFAGDAPPLVRVGDATLLGPADADAVFLDPARRTAGHSGTRRIASPDDYSPSLSFAFDLARRMPTGVKLGPGLDRELIPDEAEAQWVSVDGQVVETALWFGSLARPGVRRAALVVRRDEAFELVSDADAPDVEVAPLGEYLYEPDGAVIRARLIGLLAERLGAGMVSSGIAYLTSDEAIDTPFASRFRVVTTLSAREKDLRRELSARDIGTLEIKKRGADVDPAALRKRLKLGGARSATLFLTRDAAGRHTAILAERET